MFLYNTPVQQITLNVPRSLLVLVLLASSCMLQPGLAKKKAPLSQLRYKYGLGLASEHHYLEAIDYQSDQPHQTTHAMNLFGLAASVHVMNQVHYHLGLKWLLNETQYKESYMNLGTAQHESFTPDTQIIKIKATIGYDMAPKRLIKAHIYTGIAFKQFYNAPIGNHDEEQTNGTIANLLTPLTLTQQQWFIPIGVRATLAHSTHWKFKAELYFQWLIQGINKYKHSNGVMTYLDHKGYTIGFNFPMYYQTTSKHISAQIKPYFNLTVVNKQPLTTLVTHAHQANVATTLSHQYDEHNIGLSLTLQFH
jgi:hypothetical protein